MLSLQNYFDREVLNRFKHILQFKELSKDIYKEILTDQYEIAYNEMLTKFPQYTLEPELSDELIEKMISETSITRKTVSKKLPLHQVFL